MATPQENLNAAYPSPNIGDVVQDLATGDYWEWDGSLWVQKSITIGTYIDLTSNLTPFNEVVAYSNGVKVEGVVNAYRYSITPIVAEISQDITIGGSVESFQKIIFLPPPLFMTIAGEAPSVLLETAVVYVDFAQSVIGNALAPSIENSYVNIREDQTPSIAILGYEPVVETDLSIRQPAKIFAGVFAFNIPYVVGSIPVNTTPQLTITGRIPDSIGDFLSPETATLSISANVPLVLQSVPTVGLFVFNPILNTPKVSLTPYVGAPVGITIETTSPVVGAGLEINTVPVEIGIRAHAPIAVEAYPDVWDEGWWGGWTLNWNQAENTQLMNFIGYTTPEQEDVDVATAWNKPFLQDAYKTNAGVQSPNPINSINGRRAVAPTPLYPNNSSQVYSGEFTSSNEGCPSIVFTETINFGHPELDYNATDVAYSYDKDHSPFADYEFTSRPWAFDNPSDKKTLIPDSNDIGDELADGWRKGFFTTNFFHPGGSKFLNRPYIGVSPEDPNYHSSHANLHGVFTLEMWVYPLAANFTGTTAEHYVPLICQNMYWQRDASHDPYLNGIFTPFTETRGDNYYIGYDLYFYGPAAGSTGTVCFRGCTDKKYYDNTGASSTENDDLLARYGIAGYEYTSVVQHAANGRQVTTAEEATLYEHRVTGAANQLIADQWNHIVIHSDACGYCNIAVNGVWGADQRLRPSQTGAHYGTGALRATECEEVSNLRFRDFPSLGMQYTFEYVVGQQSAINIARKKSGKISGFWEENQDITDSMKWLYDMNHSAFTRITLGAFTEPFYTWDNLAEAQGTGQTYIANGAFVDVSDINFQTVSTINSQTTDLSVFNNASYIYVSGSNGGQNDGRFKVLGATATQISLEGSPLTVNLTFQNVAIEEDGAFAELVPGIHNRFQGYIHEIRYMPYMRYDDRYWRGTYLADSPNAPAGTFSYPGTSGIPGVTWPNFDTNLPDKPFPYSFELRDYDGTLHKVCNSIYEPELRKYYWHALNRTSHLSQYYQAWTGIPNEWFRAVNQFIIGCKKDDNWLKMDDVYLFTGYAKWVDDGFTLKGSPLTDYQEDILSTSGYEYVTRQPAYDRFKGVSNSLGGDTPTYLLRGIRLPAVNADWPEGNHHRACWITKVGSGPVFSSGNGEIGGTTCNWVPGRGGIEHGFVTNSTVTEGADAGTYSQQTGGFIGFSRTNRTSYDYIIPGLTGVQTREAASQTPWMEPVELLKTSTNQADDYPTVSLANHWMGFYSHGSGVDLEKLEYRVSTLMTTLEGLKNQFQPEQYYKGLNP